MAYLEENEWMLLNEVAYNISYIYSLDEMQEKILSWMKFLIEYDGAVFSLIESNKGTYQLQNTFGNGLEAKYLKIWKEETLESDLTRWIVYSGKNTAFRESDLISEEKRQETRVYKNFYIPNNFYHAVGLCIVFKEDPVGIIKLYRKREKADFSERDLFVLDQLQKHFAYRLSYEAKKGDTRYFYAKGYHEKICKKYQLTEREGEIFRYAVEGYTNVEIGEKMNVSIHTVKKHFQSIYGKMNVSNRVQLLQCLPLSTSKLDLDEL